MLKSKFFRESTFTINISKAPVLTEFSSFFCQIEMNAHATVWKNEKFTLTQNFFRQINYLFSNFVSKIVIFTKFLPKKSESKFP